MTLQDVTQLSVMLILNMNVTNVVPYYLSMFCLKSTAANVCVYVCVCVSVCMQKSNKVQSVIYRFESLSAKIGFPVSNGFNRTCSR